jgi:hypothetical protein
VRERAEELAVLAYELADQLFNERVEHLRTAARGDRESLLHASRKLSKMRPDIGPRQQIALAYLIAAAGRAEEAQILQFPDLSDD